jgi:glutamate synthase domain-containing protein 2
MSAGDRGVDFVTIDGGEGGTGAAPMAFADSVSLPFRVGFSRVYKVFAEAGLQDDVTFVGGGKLGLPDNAVVAMALGCDLLNVAREAMLAVGCIQAQKCHTDKCPTGVATQDPWLSHGLDPTLKSVRVANYIRTLRRDLLKLAETCGVAHPSLIDADDIEVLNGSSSGRPLREVYGYQPHWGGVSQEQRVAVETLMSGAPVGGTAPRS